MTAGVLAAGGTTPGGTAGAVAVTIAAVLAYFLPSLIGWRRGVSSLGSVVVVNVFLGWTVIGWIVALALAFRSPQPRPQPPPG